MIIVINRMKYLFLILIILAIISVLFLLNSTKFVQWAADKYGPYYSLGYKQVSGTLLTGLEVEGLTFQGDILFDKLKADWNPASLLSNRLSFTHLEVNGLHVQNIKRALKALVPVKLKENGNRYSIPFSVDVEVLKLRCDPFKERGIELKELLVEGKDIVFNKEEVAVEELYLFLKDINATAMKKFVKSTDLYQVNKLASRDKNSIFNAFLPKYLDLKHLELSVKNMVYDPVFIKNSELNGTNIFVDLSTLTAQSGEVDLNVESNIASFIQHGVIKNDQIESKGYITADKRFFEDYRLPQIKKIALENILTWKDGVVRYKGKVTPGEMELVDANYSTLIDDLAIGFEGSTDGIKADIDSKGLKGNLVSSDFKTGDFTLSTKQPIEVNTMISLPNELNTSYVEADIHIPLNFDHLMPLNAAVKIRSNLANMEADATLDQVLRVNIYTVFPEDSLLRRLSPELNFDALTPLEVNLTLADKAWHAYMRSKGVISQVNFDPEHKEIDGYTKFGNTKLDFKGNIEKKITLEHNIVSIKDFFKQVNTIYALNAPPLDGDAKLSVVLTDLKDVTLTLNSKNLVYKAENKREHIFKNTMISLGLSDSVLLLNQYHTTFGEQKFFSHKPSIITFKDGNIYVDPLWLNNELKITGKYNFNSQEGQGSFVADAFKVLYKKSDLTNRINIRTKTSEFKTDIQGSITLLDGTIHQEIETKRFSPDSDIIDVKEVKKRESMLYMTNLSTSIKVNTVKAIGFKTDKADVEIDADLMIQKAYKEPIGVLGTIKILDGSSYSISNKKFLFKDSTINLLGDPFNPFLDITTIYKTRQSEIMIQVAGDLHNPNIIFSSTPHMSRKRILSTILFDVQDHTENISEENMLLMMGDSMSKSLFSNIGGETIKYVFSTIGINIDKLPFIGRSWDANQTKGAFFSFFSFEDEPEFPGHEIHFKGHKHITKKELQKAMGVQTNSIFTFWKEDKPKIIDRLLPTLERSLQNFYASEGFYNAAFSIDRSKTEVIVSINENEPVKIQDINIESDYPISELITLKKGQIFRSKEFVSIKKNIIDDLMKDGYCSYDLDSKAYVDKDAHTVNLDFKLKKGDICTFGALAIKGPETVDDSVIISRLRAREGETFSTTKIQETYDALNKLNVFEHISVGHDRKFYNVVPIEIEGSEVKRPWYFSADVDYTSSDGFRLSTEVKRTNFLGNAKNIGLDFTYSRIEKGLELSYFVPALFKVSDYYFDFTSKVGLSEFTYEGFTEEKKYGEMLLSYNDEDWNLNAGLALEKIGILTGANLFSAPVQPGSFVPIYPYFNFKYDKRDSKVYPKYGYTIGGEIEYGIPYNEENAYLKYSLEGEMIYTFSNITYSAIAKAGIVDYNDENIPESKRFFAGGFESNRAYGYNEIGVITSPTSYTIEGGATMANLSLEACYPIGENLYAEIFNDNTMITKEDYDFSGDIISSAGLGIGYRTPLGQIKLDVGMNVRDPSIYEVNLYIGQSF